MTRVLVLEPRSQHPETSGPLALEASSRSNRGYGYGESRRRLIRHSKMIHMSLAVKWFSSTR